MPVTRDPSLEGLTLPISKKGTSCPFDPAVLKHATDIDRRKCHRVVPMEVLVLGLSRTGTASLRHALFELGYFDVYHGSCYCSENPRDCDMWTEALRGKYEGGRPFEKNDWDQLFGHCMAVTDTPCDSFADSLIASYPDAKVILSLRDSPAVWRESMLRTVVRTAKEYARPSLLAKMISFFLPKTPQAPMFDLYTRHNRLLEIPQHGERMYIEHNDWIRSLVKDKSRLLEYNVKEGWDPLCTFLIKEVPKDKEFPRMNNEEKYRTTEEEFKKMMLMLALRNMLWWVGLPVLLVAVVGGWATR